MFEEVCLVCGKPLTDDGRAYCSSDCENYDMSSPSMSSTSSALSSPRLGHAAGGEVPPLASSALGIALKKHQTSDRYSISSSSASSTSWSVSTDDEGEEPVLSINIEYNQPDAVDPLCEANAYPMWSAGLSYARLPSGTNNRSTVPNLHKRTASLSPGHVLGIPRSAPNHSISSASAEEAQSDFEFSSRGSTTVDEISRPPLSDGGSATSIPKSKHTRNRASLPAYFSLLQISNSGQEPRSSPVSSSSGHTIARTSPPTPKLTLSTCSIHPYTPGSTLALGDANQVTVRGRRRVPGTSCWVNRQSAHSSSRSRSRPHYDVPCADMLLGMTSQRPETRDVLRHTLNWASDPCKSRAQNTTKKNGSPPLKMQPARLDDYPSMRRGRLRTEELDAFSSDAPGLGHGRSGLVDRERAIGTRATLYY